MKRRKDSITNDGIRSIFELPLHLPIRQFSSGMLQRVKLALAFFTDSALLLLDEPTETLDENGFELYELLLEKYSHGRTIIIASNKERDFINCESILRMTDYSE
jgi:ABC-type multidrug transport system ATPase subunit